MVRDGAATSWTSSQTLTWTINYAGGCRSRMIRSESRMISDATRRSRLTYSTLLTLTIAAGLASRRFGAVLPVFIATYAGDTLWAAMVFWGLALAAPRARTIS